MAPNKQAAKIKADLFIALLVGNPAKMLPLFSQLQAGKPGSDIVAAVYDRRPTVENVPPPIPHSGSQTLFLPVMSLSHAGD
jgi:hypothetical protein